MPARRLVLQRLIHGSCASALALAALASGSTVLAQSSAPLRIVVPLGPGSGADVSARFLARRYEAVTGKPAIVENKPGANLAIGTLAVINAPADGQTLLYITPSSMVINPIVEKDLAYNPQRDLTPLVQLTEGPSVLVVRPDSPYKTFQDLVTAAKAKPGTVSYANYGHYYRFAALDIERMTGARFNHVNYKGGGQANTDVIGGQVDVHGTDVSGARPLIESGKLRPIAQTGLARHPFLPDVPTVAELGHPGWDSVVWTGFAVSSKTPPERVKALEQVWVAIAKSPEFAEFSRTTLGATVAPRSGQAFVDYLAQNTAKYRELAKLDAPAKP